MQRGPLGELLDGDPRARAVGVDLADAHRHAVEPVDQRLAHEHDRFPALAASLAVRLELDELEEAEREALDRVHRLADELQPSGRRHARELEARGLGIVPATVPDGGGHSYPTMFLQDQQISAQ